MTSDATKEIIEIVQIRTRCYKKKRKSETTVVPYKEIYEGIRQK